jgi:hypothetical protein
MYSLKEAESPSEGTVLQSEQPVKTGVLSPQLRCFMMVLLFGRFLANTYVTQTTVLHCPITLASADGSVYNEIIHPT